MCASVAACSLALVRWHLGSDHVFEICVESFFRIQLEAVAGQIEHFDVLAMRRQPRFHRLAVMDTQVIQNEALCAGCL